MKENDPSNSTIPSAFPDVELCCIPDYLLEATSDYREGKQYYESSLFDEASRKFANAVTIIATNDPLYMQMNSFFSPLTSVIVNFVNMKCDQSLGKKLPLADYGHIAKALVMNMKELFEEQPDYRKQSNSQCRDITCGKKSTESQEFTDSMKTLMTDYGSDSTVLKNDLLQGVICVMLAEIVMSLASCHQIKGESQDYHDLYHASNRLQKMVFGDHTMTKKISSGDLTRFVSKDDDHHTSSHEKHVKSEQDKFIVSQECHQSKDMGDSLHPDYFEINMKKYRDKNNHNDEDEMWCNLFD